MKKTTRKKASPAIADIIKNLNAFTRTRRWEKYQTPKNLAMALSVEAAELVEIFQWLSAEESKKLNAKERKALKRELADIFNYLLKIADHFDIDLCRAALRKIEENKRKYPVKKAHAAGRGRRNHSARSRK